MTAQLLLQPTQDRGDGLDTLAPSEEGSAAVCRVLCALMAHTAGAGLPPAWNLLRDAL